MGRWVGGLRGALLLAMVPSCFDPGDALRGKPCTSDASCGELSCSYGFCGGPPRCERGAGVGDYCFELDPESFAIADSARALAVGRVDLDPFPDVVTVSDGGRVSLLVNDGMGGLAPSIDSDVIAGGPTGLGIGDVDGAGWHEIVATTEDGRVVIAPVTDTGFPAPIIAGSGLMDPALPTVGNFFADLQGGVPDVAVLVGDGMGVLPQGEPLSFDDAVITYVDSPSDIATLSEDGAFAYVSRTSENDIQVLERGLDGHYTPLDVIDVGGPPARFLLADLDGDDYGDILSADTDGKLWLTSAKTASPESPEDWAKPKLVYELGWVPAVVAVGNLDDDADLEIIVAGPADGERSDVFLFDNDGDGAPIYGGSLGVPEGIAVAVGELDGDGVPEIVVASDAVRIARRTVAPPPPGETTSGESGPGPMTSVDTVEPTTDDPTVFPTEGPSEETFADGTVGPDCPFYQLDLLCLAPTATYEHGFAVITHMVELRGIASAQLFGIVPGMGDEPVGVVSVLFGLETPGQYEQQGLTELGVVATGADIGFLVDGGGGDAAVTFADGVLIFSGPDLVAAYAPGANVREPIITDVGDDLLGDVIMAVDDGVGLLRGSVIESLLMGGNEAVIEVFPIGTFYDLDRVPVIAPTPAIAIASPPAGDSLVGIGSDGAMLSMVTTYPGSNAAFSAIGSNGLGDSFVVAASVADKAPQLQVAFSAGFDTWNVAAPLGSADGIVHDLVIVDFNADGFEDVFGMFEDLEGARRIDVWLGRGDSFDQVASITDVPGATTMLPVKRDETTWDLLVADTTTIWAFSQVYYGL